MRMMRDEDGGGWESYVLMMMVDEDYAHNNDEDDAHKSDDLKSHIITFAFMLKIIFFYLYNS